MTWALLFRRAEDRCTTSEWEVGALGKVSVIISTSGIWYRSSEAKRQEGREEGLQRTKEQKHPEKMRLHALHCG